MVSELIGRLLGGKAHLGVDQRDIGWADVLATTKAALSAMERPAVRLEIEQGEPVPDMPVSSIGGRPSLPRGADWPRDMRGVPMVFIAQINYAEMPALGGFPKNGLLSFFVSGDDHSGCDFPSRGQSGFVTLFHPDPALLIRRDLPATDEELFTPYSRHLHATGAPLSGHADRCLPSGTCYATEGLVSAWPGRAPREVSDDLHDWLIERRPGALYYGGHPDFIQYDIRRAGDQPAYSEVLLQQGHLWDTSRDWEVCWGDAGEATFLMTASDLEARRFDRAIYTWDCG